MTIINVLLRSGRTSFSTGHVTERSSVSPPLSCRRCRRPSSRDWRSARPAAIPAPVRHFWVESSYLNTDRIRRRSGSRQGGGTRPMAERRCEETSEIARVADAGPFHESPYQPADEKGQRHQSYWSPDAECALRQFEHQPMGQIQAIRNSTKPLWQVGLRETDFETPNERSMLRRRKKVRRRTSYRLSPPQR